MIAVRTKSAVDSDITSFCTYVFVFCRNKKYFLNNNYKTIKKDLALFDKITLSNLFLTRFCRESRFRILNRNFFLILLIALLSIILGKCIISSINSNNNIHTYAYKYIINFIYFLFLLY